MEKDVFLHVSFNNFYLCSSLVIIKQKIIMKYHFIAIAALALICKPINLIAESPDVFFSTDLENTFLNVPHRPMPGKFEGHFPAFYMGVNLLCDENSYSTTAGLPQRKGKGMEFGSYFAEEECPINRQNTLGITIACGISRSRYWISDGQYLDWQNVGGKRELTLMPNGNDVKQGYIRYWSLRVPVCLEFQSQNKKGLFLSVGPEFEYRFGDVSKVKYEGGGKDKLTKDLNINPIGLNLLAQAGVDDIGIIFRYSFAELFSDSSPVETYPMMLGLSLAF